jgi:hypothetical protein
VRIVDATVTRPHIIPVDLVGYDVDLIPEKASVQCRRFDPATGNVLLFVQISLFNSLIS